MTEEVRQTLRICPPGLRQAIDRLPDAGAMEELRLRCGQSRPLQHSAELVPPRGAAGIGQ